MRSRISILLLNYDYQLSKARGKFGYEVLASKLWCCHGQPTSFPLVTISIAVGRLSRRLQFRALCCQLTSKAEKLPTDTEPVARDNNAIFTLKLGDQTFVSPYSTDNRSNSIMNSKSRFAFNGETFQSEWNWSERVRSNAPHLTLRLFGFLFWRGIPVFSPRRNNLHLKFHLSRYTQAPYTLRRTNLKTVLSFWKLWQRVFPLWTLTGGKRAFRGLTGWTTVLVSVISSEQLVCCGKGTCHGFHSSVGSATNGNKDTQRTWTSRVYSSFFNFDINGKCKSYYKGKSTILILVRTRLHHPRYNWKKAE